MRALGMNPEKLLTREALAEGATTYNDQADLENHQLTVLSNQLKQLIQQAANTSGPAKSLLKQVFDVLHDELRLVKGSLQRFARIFKVVYQG